jgi:hypothetical protein
MLHAIFRHRVQRAVAPQTARERRGERDQIEAPQHLEKLLSRLGLTNEIAPDDRAVLEDADVTGEHRSTLGGRDGDDLVIVVVVAIRGVETGETEIRRESPKMNVSDEARNGLRGRPETDSIPEIDRAEGRKYRDAIAVAHAISKIHGLAADDEQVDLRVRHAEHLDEVLHCRGAVEGAEQRRLPARRGQKVVELAVETHRDRHHKQILQSRWRSSVPTTWPGVHACEAAVRRVADPHGKGALPAHPVERVVTLQPPGVLQLHEQLIGLQMPTIK